MSLFTDKNVTPVVVYDESGNPVGGGVSALPLGADKSSTIATGGQYQTLAAANPARKSLVGQNLSTGDLWVNEGGGNAAADTPGSYRVAAGQAFAVGTSRAISIVGATTGQKFTATET